MPEQRDEDALRDEARFADRQYAPHANDLGINPAMLRKYTHPLELWDWRQLAAVLLGDLEGKLLLDLGCGMGEESVYFARMGARVKAIDISEEGVRILQRRAEHNGLTHLIDPQVMRADRTLFADNTFDVVHGLGILHHIGLQIGLDEVRRILRPGGIGVFLEPLGDSPTIELIKRWLMKNLRFMGFEEVTEHEENLRFRDLELEADHFSAFHTYPFHLLYRVKRFVPRVAWDGLRRIDCGALALVPSLRHLAGAVVIKVRK